MSQDPVGRSEAPQWLRDALALLDETKDAPAPESYTTVGEYLDSKRPLSMREVGGQALAGANRALAAIPGEGLKAIGVAGSRIAQGVLDVTGSGRQVRGPESTEVYRQGQAIEDFSAANLEGSAVTRPHAKSAGSFIAEDLVPAAAGMVPALMTGGAATGVLLAQMTAQQAMHGYAEAKAKNPEDDETAWKAFLWNMPIGAAYLLGPGRQVANLSKALAAVEQQTGRSVSRWMLGNAVGGAENASGQALGNLVGQQLGSSDAELLDGVASAGGVGLALSGFFGAAAEAARAKAPKSVESGASPRGAGEMPNAPDEPVKAGEVPAKAQEPRAPTAVASADAAPQDTAAREAAIEQSIQRVAAKRGLEVVRRAPPETPEAQFFEEWMGQHGKEAVGIEPGAGGDGRFRASLDGDVVVYNAKLDPADLRGAVLYHEGAHALPKDAQARIEAVARRIDPEGWAESDSHVSREYGEAAKAEGALATYAERISDWLGAGEARPDRLAALLQHDPGAFVQFVDSIKLVARKLGLGEWQTSLEKKVAEFGRGLEAGSLGPQKTAELVKAFLDEFEQLRGREPVLVPQERAAPAAPPPAAEPPAPVEAPAVVAPVAEPQPPPAAKAPKRAPKPKKEPKAAPKVEVRQGVRTVEPVAVKPTEGARGREAELVLPDGKALPVRYRVVDARELLASHDPTQGYARVKGGDINERDYGHPVEGRAYRDTVEKIAANPKPGLVFTDTPSASDGPPIVGPGLRVLGGNARSMGLQLAYAKGGDGATRLREAALESAARFGIDPESIAGVERPVLVRELDAANAGAPGEMSRILNQPLTTAKTANTEAVSRGSKIDEATALEIGRVVGDGTVREAFNDPTSSAELVRALVKSGAFSDSDITALLDNRGLLTQAGRDIVEQTLLGSVVTNLATLSELPPSSRATVVKALPHIIRARAHWDAFGPSFVNALEAAIEVRQTGRSLREVRAQALMPGLEAGWKTDPLAIRIAERLLDDTPTEFSRRIGVLADGLKAIDDGQGDLFAPGGKLTHERALEDALGSQAEREAQAVRPVDEAPAEGAGAKDQGETLFALSPGPRPRRGVPEHDKLEAANTAIVESFRRAHTVEASLANPNKANRSIRRTEELMHGKVGAHDQWVDQHYVKASTKAMREGQIHPSEDAPGKPSGSKYLTALHAPKRNDTLRKRHPRKFGLQANPGSGMSDLEAAAIIREAHQSPAAAQYRELQRINRELNDHFLDLAVESGLITPAHRATLVQEFGLDYVPLKTYVDGAEQYFGGGRSMGVSGAEFKRAEGRITLADNPLVFQIQGKLALARRAEKNRVDLALREAVIRNPNTALWEYQRKRSEISDLDFTAGKVLPFKFRGEDRWVVFHDAALAEAFKARDKVLAGSAVRVIDSVNGFLRGSFIKYNPAWAVVNPIRDLVTAVPKAAAKYGYSFAWDVARNQVLAGIGAFRAMRDPNAKGYWADRYREAAQAGGLVSWTDFLTWSQRLKSLEAEVTRDNALQSVHETGRILAALTTASEMGTRLAAFDAAQRRGMGSTESAWIMRNVTTDFARRGTTAGFYGRVWLFAGANVQGARSSVEWLRANPRRSAVILGSMIGIGYVLAAASRELADENESGLNEFDAVSDQSLSRKLGVMVGKVYVGMPMPWFFNTFLNLGRRMEQVHNGRLTLADLSEGTARDVLLAFSPVQGATVGQALTPTLGRPFMEIATNQDFAGRPILRDPFPTDITPPPNSEQFFDDVNPALREGARALNRWTGGDTVNAGYVDINPEWIEHVVKFALGGVGTQSQRAWDTARKVISGEVPSPNEVPVLSSFASTSTPYLHKSLFKEAFKSIAYAHDTAEKARQTGQPIDEATRHLDSLHDRARIAENQAKRYTKAGKDDEALKVMQEFNRYFESVRE